MASFFLPLFLSFNFILLFCNAEDTVHKSKSVLVEGILHKVFNLTLKSFGNLPYEQRRNMMIKIEHKLKKSAQSLGPKSKKYVDLLMKGVKSVVSKHNDPNDHDDVSARSSDDDVEKKRIQKKKTSTRVKKTDEEYIEDTANKIQFIVDKTLHNHKEGENTVGRIEQKVESVVEKLLMPNKQNEKLLKTDTALRQKIIKMIKESTKRNEVKKDNARRMEFEFNENINVAKVSKALENKDSESRKSFTVNSSTVDHIDNLPSIRNPEYKNVTLKSGCHDFNVKIICAEIKALKTITCNNKEMPVLHLCDGINQCLDHSDERDCAIQGIYKVRNASKIMSDIEYGLSEKCFHANFAKSIISKQNKLLGNVLQRQLKFIEKHNNDTLELSSYTTMKKFYVQPKPIRDTVQQVAFVITTLSSALLKTVCPTENDARRFNTDDDDFFEKFEEESPRTTTWTPHSCSCFEEFCVGNCSEDCNGICLQRFQIDKWQCKAVSRKNTISLDLICDGKLDCYDATDENGCNIVSDLAKFESGDIYNSVLDMISTKTKSALFEKVRYKLINLENIVKKLQKSTTRRNPDVLEVKALRDECFYAMTEIYDQTKYYGPHTTVMYDTYVFLLSLNQKLVSAMKRSHTGNEMMVAPDGCFCRDDQCALHKCSEKCIRACPAKLKLTRYYCGGSLASNNSISIDGICNGKNDCSENDDEQGCSNDICRTHHFVLLRHNLNKTNEGNRDTPVGNAINFWKTKVSLMLMVLETNERPSPQALRNIVHDMLVDLLSTYAGLTTVKRRSSEEVISEFYKMSLVVMNALKSCSK